jgi:type IV pilus assembly protein PilM
VPPLLSRLFPTPAFIAAPTVGLDFSDATMRFVRLAERRHGLMPVAFAEMAIPEGCMQGGRVINERAFTLFLIEVRKKYKLKYVRVSIPESQVYSFTLAIDSVAKDDIRGAIELVLEENIPLRAIEAVFDYEVLSENETSIVVQVMAVSEVVAQSYFGCFNDAGLIPVSFELDGQAIARAVLKQGNPDSAMIVDFGAHRSSITIVTNGTAVYTSTLDFGGKTLIESLSKELSIDIEEAGRLMREFGISTVGQHKDIFSSLIGGISILKDEINRRYVYWHDRKDQYGAFPTIKTVYLCGGNSNISGICDYLSVMLKLNVVQANPWVNCMSFENAVPELPREQAMSYVTAIGLALADYHD